MIAIIDYGAGNLASVRRALEYLDIEAKIISAPANLDEFTGVIFPGVGHAATAMNALQASGLGKWIIKAIEGGVPLLGICLGCQILLKESEEGSTTTLGAIPGKCKKFDPNLRAEDGGVISIPHMGWNNLLISKTSPLLEGISEEDEFYFVHSYYAEPAPEFVIASTVYGQEFCAIYGRDGLWATQFHPEKSGPAGLRILKNFNRWCQSRALQTRNCLS